MYSARRLSHEKKAIVFCTPEKIAGAKIGGILLPKKIFDELVALEKSLIQVEKEAQEEEKRAIVAGEKPIQLRYHDGEYLSGYMVFGHAEKLLLALGLAKEISGWGTHVDPDAVKALGTEFTYPEAVEYTRPAREAAEKIAAKKKAERQAKFDEAAATGSPVVLYKWSEECNNPREECNVDNLTEYAMPDGTTKTERHHTW